MSDPPRKMRPSIPEPPEQSALKRVIRIREITGCSLDEAKQVDDMYRGWQFKAAEFPPKEQDDG